MARVGEIFELGDWIRGDADENEITKSKKALEKCFTRAEERHRMLLGEIEWETLGPEHPRVPEPPSPDMVMLVGWAEVRATAPSVVMCRESFIAGLDRQDHERLRAITRRVAKRPLTNAECDALIERIGPRALEKTVRAAIDLKLVN